MSSARSDGRKCHRVRCNCGLWYTLAAMIVVTGTVPALAQCTEQQKLTADDAGANYRFGKSVSVSGQTVVVGSPFDSCGTGVSCGAAYVYRLNGTSWVAEQKLTASDATVEDHFGGSVSVSGETIVVGAAQDDCAAGVNCGSTYVFRFNGTSWVEEQKLTASDAAWQAWFGVSVTVGGDTVVVGADTISCAAGFACGAAYVFRFNGTSWVEEEKLTASDAAPFDQFGNSVSVTRNTVVVGAYLDACTTIGTRCGSAYVFTFNGTSWPRRRRRSASARRSRRFR